MEEKKTRSFATYYKSDINWFVAGRICGVVETVLNGVYTGYMRQPVEDSSPIIYIFKATDAEYEELKARLRNFSPTKMVKVIFGDELKEWRRRKGSES